MEPKQDMWYKRFNSGRSHLVLSIEKLRWSIPPYDMMVKITRCINIPNYLWCIIIGFFGLARLFFGGGGVKVLPNFRNVVKCISEMIRFYLRDTQKNPFNFKDHAYKI